VGRKREAGLDATREMIKGGIKGNAGRLLGANVEEMLDMLTVAETDIIYRHLFTLIFLSWFGGSK
jgi:hypothetical protein